MKVILLDDEKHALNYLEHQLLKIADIQLIGKFADPIAGKEHILQEDVDVVFLDINMRGVNGIELAEQILESKPYLNIVFVTAYDEYAIKAFELNALDYVLKPVGAERLRKSIERVKERLKDSSGSALRPARSIRINLFRQVSIETDDDPLTHIRWRTTRAQELFLYLLQHRGQLVRKSIITDLLWPDYDPSKAYSQMYTAIYHIRKTMEPYADYIKISNATDGYILDTENVVLDVEEWEKQIQSAPPITAETIGTLERLMVLYTGDYLQELEYWWAESERHRLKLMWIRMSFQMAEWYISNGRQEKAIEKYLEICTHHPQAEEAHFALMQLYAAENNHVSVHRQYRMLASVLMEELNEQPSPYITEWYDGWNQSK